MSAAIPHAVTTITPFGPPAGGPDAPLPGGPRAARAIFRPAALQHYRDREQSVVPRYATAPMFALLWAVLAVLLADGVVLVVEYLARRGGV